MLLGMSVLVGLCAALLMGARWDALADVRWRLAPLCLAGLGIQLILFSSDPTVAGPFVPIAPALHVGSILLVLTSLAANVRTPGIAFVLLGAALNLAVIMANGGQMPGTVPPPDLSFSNTTTMDEHTRLAVLGDWLQPPLLPHRRFSIGDVLIAGGAGFAVFRLARTRRLADSAFPQRLA